MRTDQQLKEDVTRELRWEPTVEEAHIGVSVKDGIVTLCGHVPSYAEKHGAELAARRTVGMRALANELDVRLSSSTKRTEESIAQECLSALRACEIPAGDALAVIVENGGWVTLAGTVETPAQRCAAEQAVRFLGGVVGVTNQIEIR